MIDKNGTACGEGRTGFLARYKEQYRQNMMLALPVALTQLGQILTQIVDNLMVGHYGGTSSTLLAAISFGGVVSMLFFFAAIGIALGLTPLIGELHAQGKKRQAAALLQNGIAMYVLLGVAISAVQYAIVPLMYHMGQPAEVVDMAIPYYAFHNAVLCLQAVFRGHRQHEGGTGCHHNSKHSELYS